MTIELERSHSTLEHLEVPEGYKAEIVNGEIVLWPTRAFHFGTIVELVRQITPQLPETLRYTGDTITPFPEENSELCPDIIILPKAEYEKNSAVYPAEVIEAAFEVVSPSTGSRDYGLKVGAYARAGIPLYIIADPYAAQLVVQHKPIDGEYAYRNIVPYGEKAEVPGDLPLAIDTSELPADTKS
ncbi:Uma2 family endonuclease [Streptantibioticus ferralitis]|uniref:Uma2 family endonuclease n=1 Tax=Streptantibioticus ferralitis TaxID=236510 RepID=A0ABT5Z971_9ACTN|nr:Uma2 family endonuclease [Streptantibioticus ferralitis]MDF2260380.1 Uma2 family endonuclease [Streptantibioticus ferralitis]